MSRSEIDSAISWYQAHIICVIQDRYADIVVKYYRLIECVPFDDLLHRKYIAQIKTMDYMFREIFHEEGLRLSYLRTGDHVKIWVCNSEGMIGLPVTRYI